jgi:hypothetical protein
LRLRVEGKSRNRGGVVDRQFLQRFEEGLGRVQFEFFVGAMWAGNDLGLRAARHIALKNIIGIVKVGKDERESGEVTRQIFVKPAITSEEAGQRPRFDGSYLVREATCQASCAICG